MGTTVVFSEDALAPGSAALWRAALEHLQRRYAAIRELDLAALPDDRTAAAAALDAWDGGAGWRREVGRYYDDHARLHLRRDPTTGALLRRLRADGSQLGAYGAGPREASEAVLRFLGLDRLTEAVERVGRRLDALEGIDRMSREFQNLSRSLESLAYAALGARGPNIRRPNE